MIRCIDEVKEQVRRDVGLSVTDAQVERVLAGKPCSMDEDARSIIQKQGRLYTERLLSAAMEAGFDLKAIPVVMLGGGAAVVKRNVAPQDALESTLRRILREELQAVPSQPVQQPEETIPPEMLGFLNTLMDDE